MGESSDTPLKLQFDRRVRLDFRGATITSNAGLLACRELDAALGLTETANDYIHESRTGRNVQHRLLPLLRQSVYSRLAGYEDTNDAERLAQDPAMRVIVGWQGTDKQAASTNTMSRFETEVLTEEENLDGLARLNVTVGLYWTVNAAVFLTALVSLLTGWYPLVLEGGLPVLGGFTMDIGNETYFEISFNFNLIGFFGLVAAVSFLMGAVSAARALGSSSSSWAA